MPPIDLPSLDSLNTHLSDQHFFFDSNNVVNSHRLKAHLADAVCRLGAGLLAAIGAPASS